MLIHVVADKPSRIRPIREIAEPKHRVIPIWPEDNAKLEPDDVLIIDVDLRQAASIDQIREFLRKIGQVRHKIFVVDKGAHSLLVQAHALGATATVHRPLEAHNLLHKLSLLDVSAPRTGRHAAPTPPGLANSAAVFASMFAALLDGRPIVLSDAKQATDHIIDSVSQNGLSSWLDDVRKYHEGTFQHCLLVSGVAVSFALKLDFSVADVHRLGLAATLHDVGKASIPLAILDKPDRLDAAEEKIMRQHPTIGYDALKTVDGLEAEVLDAIRHHHEFLDGSGYPDALTAPAISDIVRLLTIADIYAALIESRPYRPPMSRQKAYDVLGDMGGKVERALVRAFRPVALSA